MYSHRWRRILVAVLAVPAFGLFLVACGGGEPSPTPTPTATVTQTPTPTGAGFLPTHTPEPTPTRVPGASSGPVGDCPPLPGSICAQPGDTSNIYREVNMGRATRLRARFYGGVNEWVLEPSQVAEILRSLDRQVDLLPDTIPVPPVPGRERFELTVFWPEGSEPVTGFTMKSFSFDVRLDEGIMGQDFVRVEWPIPPEFGDLLFRYLSDVAPTPARRPPARTPAPTPTIVPPGAIFFDHPDGELTWDGPDDRVSTIPGDHCSGRNREFGVPGHIRVRDGLGYWGGRAIPRENGWRWTGYYHGDWQVWQGADPTLIYVVHAEERRIAFEYRWFGCR